MSKTFFIETFGCQMNKNDSDLMQLSLVEYGFRPAHSVRDADITIYNTCSVRAHAEERVRARIISVRNAIHKRGGSIVIAGCMAQRLGHELLSNREADIVIGPYQSPDIGKILTEYTGANEQKAFLSHDTDDFSGRIRPELASMEETRPWHRWVSITHGCENFCTYCIVPYVRGRLISFPSEKILSYIDLLVKTGTTEITLLGQNVNQYGEDSNDIPFYRLLEKAASIEALERINFLTSHPKDFSEDIAGVIRDNPVISRGIHLPMQSGSNRILKLMNRKYTMEHYLAIVENLHKQLPDFSVSTDLIVGFPGETEKEFDDTLKAVQDIRFDEAFTYAYSPREGTPSFSMEENITEVEKKERLQQLITLQRSVAEKKLSERINSIEDIIIERISKKSEKHVMGKTFLNHGAVIPGDTNDIGEKMRIRITGIHGSTLKGRRIA